ncbi:MAG: hypothetical protein KW788_03200, partial [Candidatus Doudnabacteria bacterium]|nr:hypothetical protein [Candidatus Doudnabacteria bacterium]
MKTKKIHLVIILFLLTMPLLSLAQGFANCDPNSNVICKPTQSGDLKEFVISLMHYVGTIIGLIAIVTLVYAGFRMLISNGDEKKITE